MSDHVRFDAVQRLAHDGHFDASETIFVERELLRVRSAIYEVQYPQFKADALFPLYDTQPAVGQTHVTYQFTERVGKAQLVASLANDVPDASVKLTETTPRPLRNIAMSYKYTLEDLRAAAAGGKPLPMMLAKACRDAIEQERDEINLIADGTNTYHGLFGAYKLSNTVTYTPSTGNGGSILWSAKTPDEIAQDVIDLIHKVYVDSNETERPDRIHMPLSAWQDMTRARMGDSANMTIWQYVQELVTKAYPGTTMETSIRLQTAGAGGTRRMMAFVNDPSKIGRIDPNPFEQLAPQLDGFVTRTWCHARVGGIINPFPKSVGYMDGF